MSQSVVRFFFLLSQYHLQQELYASLPTTSFDGPYDLFGSALMQCSRWATFTGSFACRGLL